MQIRHRKTVLVALAALHVFMAIVFHQSRGRAIPLTSIINSGLIFAQASLLGIWAGLGKNHWAVRLIGVALGMAYFSLLDFSFYLDFSCFILSAIAVPAMLLAVRQRLILQSGNGRATSKSSKGFQFSIRHLLFFMFVAGCVLTTGKWLRTNSHVIFIYALESVGSVTVGLTSTWAMLGTSHPFRRSLIALFVAIGAGALVAIILARGEDWFLFCTIMVANALFLLASLFVVRLCGFRLVRLSRLEDQLAS